jgi:hypothetical protein
MEEAYIYVSVSCNPEHPMVIQAAGQLIEILFQTGDFYDAEHFSRICYDSLTRPTLDPESFEAAKAAGDLALASYKFRKTNHPDSGDIEEAEMLARKAVRIIKRLKGSANNEMVFSFRALIRIKFLKNDYGDETKGLLDDQLREAIREQGLDGGMTAAAYEYLGKKISSSIFLYFLLWSF